VTHRRNTLAIRAGSHAHAFRSPRAAVYVMALLMMITSCSGVPRQAQHQAPPDGEGRPAGVAQAGTVQGQSDPASSASQSDWVRFDYDPAHSGSVPATQALSAATVGGLHLLWRAHLEDTADSAPVYLHALLFPDHSRHDVLYVTAKDGTLVALDAGTGHLLWSVHTVGPEWTTSSPAADPSRRLVYFYGLDGFVHKVGVIDGKEIKTGGWPVRITNIPGREKGSAPLNIVNGRLYAALSTYAPEVPPNQGHLVVVDLANASMNVFNTVCSDIKHLLAPNECSSSGAGIWARASAVVDPVTGNVFVSTANGPYDGRVNWGDSVLELSADGTRLLDSYTPVNNAELDAANWDLGSTAPALLLQIRGSNTPYLLVQGGKDGVLRLLNRQNLSGKAGPGHVGGELQVIARPGCVTFTQPAVWQDSNQGATWIFTADTCGMAGYQVVTDQHRDTQLRQAWHLPVVTTSPLVAGGVLFAAAQNKLLALDPRSGQQLWSSAQPGAVSSPLGAIHWESPIIVGGKVYVSDESGALVAYGL
jgi:outer membrane protein assembly factor BamB